METPTVDASTTNTPPPRDPMGTGVSKNRCNTIAVMTKQPVVRIGKAKLVTTNIIRDWRKSLLPFLRSNAKIKNSTVRMIKLEPAQIAI